jgi:hypothetical protein
MRNTKMMRTLIAFATLFSMTAVHAAEKRQAATPAYTCRDIKRAVALAGGIEQVVQIARMAGASEQQIRQAKECLR